MKKIIWSIAFAAFAGSMGTAHAQLTRVRTLENITEYTLPNGLQILLVPDNAKPVATVNLTYRVGSRHEGAGETGSAHLLEHMLFKASGAISNPKGQMQTFGMRWNGTTWFDRTNYFASFLSNDNDAAKRMDFMLGWLATMMTQARFTKADLDTERTVVRNEFDRAENDSSTVLGNRMRGIAFSRHGYRHSVLGAKTDFEKMPLEGLYAFYRKHYRPDNATLIIAGRFDLDAVKQKINDAFAPIVKPDLPLHSTDVLDPVQDGERSVMLRRSGGLPTTAVLYKMPAGGTREGVAARLLAETIAQYGGPLFTGLITPKLAVTDYAVYVPTRDPGYLIAGVGLPEKATALGDDQYVVNSARSAEVLATVVETYQPTDAEIQTAKNMLMARSRALLRDAEATGQALSEMVAMGDWRLIFSIRDALAAITSEEVRTLAKNYLVASNRTAGTYLPLVASNNARARLAPATSSPGVDQLVTNDINLPGQKLASTSSTGTTATTSRALAEVAADNTVKADDFELGPTQMLQRTQRGQLTVAGAPGLQVAVLPRSSKDNRVIGTLRLRWGTTDSLKGSAVLATMLGGLLVEGTAKTNAATIRSRAQALDASISFVSTTGFLSANLEFPSANTSAVLSLLDELLRSSTFEQAAFERFQRAMLANLEGITSTPAMVASNALERSYRPPGFYIEGDPRETRIFDATRAQIQAASSIDLKAYWQRFGSAKTGELVLLGPLELTSVQTQLQTLWGNWTSGEPHIPWVFLNPPSFGDTSTRTLNISVADKASANYAARVGFTMNGNDLDFPALYTAVQLLSSRGLVDRIREKEGLSYSVEANLTAPQVGNAASIDITATFAPANLAKLRTAVREVLVERRAAGFSAREVNNTKSVILTRRVEARAFPANAVNTIANNLRFNLPLDSSAKLDEGYQSLDAAAVNAALKKYLDPAQLLDAAAGTF